MPQTKVSNIAGVNELKQQQDDAQILRWVHLVDVYRTTTDQRERDEAYLEILDSLRSRIRNLCSKFRIAGYETDDLLQEAHKALWSKAIKDYDKDRGSGEGPAPFDRFALLCIRRHLSTELKTSHQNRKKILNGCLSLDQDRNDSNDELSLVNIIPQTEGDVLLLLENREYFAKLIKKLLSKLSPFEKEVFLLYIERYTYEEIAEIINNKRLKNNRKANIKIKGVDNALSRIKTKAHGIFDKFGRLQDPSARTHPCGNCQNSSQLKPKVSPHSVDNAISRVKNKMISIREEV